tara:strand:+ start:408 stop:623 length:216 start_codon:yes stop_codon:yes gene_type:complete
MIDAYNCKTGSAWHTWQCEAATWRQANLIANPSEYAPTFATTNMIGNSTAAMAARERAFYEGVRAYDKGGK